MVEFALIYPDKDSRKELCELLNDIFKNNCAIYYSESIAYGCEHIKSSKSDIIAIDATALIPNSAGKFAEIMHTTHYSPKIFLIGTNLKDPYFNSPLLKPIVGRLNVKEIPKDGKIISSLSHIIMGYLAESKSHRKL